MIEKNDFVAFQVRVARHHAANIETKHIIKQVFTQLELQHKRKGSPFAKPPPDAEDYMNKALINALEFLEGLRDK